MKLVLASKSASRRAILTGAGIPHNAVGSDVDEPTIKDAELKNGTSPADIALVLATAKAAAVAVPDQLTLGGDQVLEFEGQLYDKPATMQAAKERLLAMSGRPHHLRAGLALFSGRDCVWHHQSSATLWMRPVTAPEVDAYLQAAGPGVLATVGAYELEGLGSRLFERVDGDYFGILGLPLFDLLVQLRRHGVVPW